MLAKLLSTQNHMQTESVILIDRLNHANYSKDNHKGNHVGGASNLPERLEREQ